GPGERGGQGGVGAGITKCPWAMVPAPLACAPSSSFMIAEDRIEVTLPLDGSDQVLVFNLDSPDPGDPKLVGHFTADAPTKIRPVHGSPGTQFCQDVPPADIIGHFLQTWEIVRDDGSADLTDLPAVSSGAFHVNWNANASFKYGIQPTGCAAEAGACSVSHGSSGWCASKNTAAAA